MSDRSLLPPNSTALERAFEEALRGALGIPIDFARLMDPRSCPEGLLGYLAWHVSVDDWDEEWPAERKRAVILASAEVHRRKGTRSAVEAAIAPFDAGWTVSEWFEHGGPPHTFRIEAEAADAVAAPSPPVAATIRDLRRAVAAAKPVRAHFAIRLRERPGAAVQPRTATRLRRRWRHDMILQEPAA